MFAVGEVLVLAKVLCSTGHHTECIERGALVVTSEIPSSVQEFEPASKFRKTVKLPDTPLICCSGEIKYSSTEVAAEVDELCRVASGSFFPSS